MYEELRRVYGSDEIPEAHLPELARQLEDQTRAYEVREEKVDIALALVKPDGFIKERDASGAECYTAEIVYPKDREHLLASFSAWHDKAGALGFHYDPYNFDSNPELSFFEQALRELKLRAEEIEDIYFTGALTDPAKTDFHVEYKDDKGKWRRYTPDFLIRRKPLAGGKPGTGKVIIVEVKSERDRGHAVDGEKGRKAMALRNLENLNPDRLRYEMIFTDSDTIPGDRLAALRQWAAGGK